MKYFTSIQNFEDLKGQYHALALANHPDAGGSEEAMKAINNQFDQLFPVWKHRSKVATSETAQSARREFYTQYGWAGANYDRNLSLKEIAARVRAFIKANYNDFKFSVRTSYASMCCELHINLMEGPCKAYKTPDEWTEEERDEADRITRRHEYEGRNQAELDRILAKLHLTDYVREAVAAVNNFVDSYRWDREYKIVPRTRKTANRTTTKTQPEKKATTAKTIEAAPSKEDETAQMVVDMIEDTSTEIIVSLGLKPHQYVTSAEYRRRMAEYVNTHRDTITLQALERLTWAALRNIIKKILREGEAGAA